MHSIDFPGDGLCLEEKHKDTPKSHGMGYIKYGETLRITFHDGGDFRQTNKYAFTKPLPEGYFGETVVAGKPVFSVLISPPAANSDQTTVLKFIKDDDGKEYRYALIVNATGQPPAKGQHP